MEYLQEISLELNSNTAYTTVGAKQGDHLSRVIKIHLTENGEDWKIPLGVTASYRVRKPDGYAIWNEAEIKSEENVILITLTEQTLAAAGRAYADILLVTNIDGEKQVLSTVSFIIIIMASPDIAENITSSNEFSRILDLTDNADIILNEAEAWAIGTKKGVPVIADNFSYAVEGGTFSCNIDENIFRQQVGESAGYTRYFIFTCTGIVEDEPWPHWMVEQGGTTLLNINLEDYGITITSGSPLQSNIIRVVVTDSDIQYQNNAKYYSELADADRQAIEDLTVSAETGLPIDHGGQAEVEKTIDETTGIVNLHFTIPKGDTGDVNFMTFDIDTNRESINYGQIIMTKPDTITPDVIFKVEDDGQLYFKIIN